MKLNWSSALRQSLTRRASAGSWRRVEVITRCSLHTPRRGFLPTLAQNSTPVFVCVVSVVIYQTTASLSTGRLPFSTFRDPEAFRRLPSDSRRL
ncbi:hypothetical protein E2C01_025573 [Portunus trituberculatus]|uniref:Uncharacterized protein n=1 Tax=Portunus trituberculatus TaxID=210409 RepID=A0A5B7EGS8_PORTR|nr:hypothetical protein [Portunus trituberculatus]